MPVRMEPVWRGLERQPSVMLRTSSSPHPTTRADPVRPTRAEETFAYELRLVHEIGVPIDGVPLSLRVSGSSRRLTTDGDCRVQAVSGGLGRQSSPREAAVAQRSGTGFPIWRNLALVFFLIGLSSCSNRSTVTTMRDWSDAEIIEDVVPLLRKQEAPIRRRHDVAAYAQLYANSGLNSHSPVVPQAGPPMRAVATLKDPSEAAGLGLQRVPSRIIGVGDREVVIDTPNASLWQISLDGVVRLRAPSRDDAEVTPSYPPAHPLVLRPGGLDYIFGNGGSHTIFVGKPEIGERPTSTPGHTVLPPNTLGLTLGPGPQTSVVAVVPLEREFLVVYNHRHLDRDAEVTEAVEVRRQQYGRGSRVSAWVRGFSGVHAFSSPALSDGSIVMHLPSWIVTLHGETGELRAEIPIRLLGHRLATDHFDRIWGFHDTGNMIHLVGLTGDGAPFFYEALSPSIVVDQPPVCYPDGRVCVVARDLVRCFALDGTVWDFPLSNDARKTATATGDGSLFIAGGTEVVRVDSAGREVWRASTPDDRRITTNVALTQNGTVCFGADHVVYCMSRNDEPEAR